MNNLIHKNKKIVLVILIAALFTFNLKVTAQTKNTIEYKTSIIDQAQQPMADGNYNFRFAIYNVANGGSALWSEDWFGVQVRRAAVSVDLGSFVPFPANLFKNTSLYLQVCLDANLAGGDGSGECAGGFEENFKPRKVLAGVPWASNASSLGPVTIAAGDTAYNVDTFGSDGTLFNLNFNDNQRFSVDSNGGLGLINGTKSFTFSPDTEQIKLTDATDIFFGDNISLRTSTSADTSGASIIGVSTAGLQNLSGNTIQSVFTNLDPLLRWRANGSSVFYNGGNVGIGTDSPAFALAVVGTGQFTNGIIIGNNTNNTAGAIRFNGTNFEGYDGVTWIPFSAGAGATTDNGAGLTYVTNAANAFGIGGNTAGTSPYLFNPLTGALIKRNTTIQNDPASPSTNLLTLNSTGANAKTGGNFDSLLANSAYTPTGGAGTETYNGLEVSSTINAGDGSNISRQRGLLSTVVNNSSGAVNGVFNLSSVTTNNGAFTNLTGYSNTITNNANGTQVIDINNFSTNNGNLAGTFRGTNNVATNNGTVGSDISGTSSFGVNTATGTAGQASGSYTQVTNDGTADFVYTGRLVGDNNGTVTNTAYGYLSDFVNRGTTPSLVGLKNNVVNDVAGNVAADLMGSFTTFTNDGTVSGTYRGAYTVGDNSGNVTGDFLGINNSLGNTGTLGGNLIGLYNVISTVGGTQAGTYGLLSTDGISTVYLNANSTYAIDTIGGAARFSNQVIVGDSTGTDEAGAIRFNGNFEGFDGITWNSLGGTGSSQWGDTGGGDIFFDTGFVGIQTNAPSTDLDVNGAARISNGLGIGQLNDGSFALEVAGAGQFANEIVVGDSLNDTAGAIRFNGTNFEGYNGTIWGSLGGSGSSQWLDDGGGGIYFDTGSVGIGSTASGAFNLEVTGTAYTTGNLRSDGQLTVNTSPGAFTFEVNGTAGFDSDVQVFGHMGVGTNPDGAYALNIAGDVNINGVVTFLQGFDAGGTINFNGGVVTVSGGDLNVTNNNLIVTNGAICADGGTGCPALTPGQIYGDLAYVEFDVAENILANPDVEAGDLVSSLNGQQEVVRKTDIANEGTLLGVISTNPGSLGGFSLKPRDGFKVVPLVLSGRVPVKVSTENGVINNGDPIASSSVSGVGMKATQSKTKILGYAMQSYDSAGVGKIVVLFQPGYLP